MTSSMERTNRLTIAYRRYLSSGNAPTFAAEVDEQYSSATLCALLGRGQVETRRASALSLGMLGNNQAIEALGRALSDHDRGVRLIADDSFRALTVRSAEPNQHQQLLRIMHLTDGGEFGVALAPAMTLVENAPGYAAAQHQLAACWHGLENFTQAELCYRACLWYCRFHYVAWQGLARCYMMSGHEWLALSALSKAIQINPDLESARMQIRVIKRRLGQDDRAL